MQPKDVALRSIISELSSLNLNFLKTTKKTRKPSVQKTSKKEMVRNSKSPGSVQIQLQGNLVIDTHNGSTFRCANTTEPVKPTTTPFVFSEPFHWLIWPHGKPPFCTH